MPNKKLIKAKALLIETIVLLNEAASASDLLGVHSASSKEAVGKRKKVVYLRLIQGGKSGDESKG